MTPTAINSPELINIGKKLKLIDTHALAESESPIEKTNNKPHKLNAAVVSANLVFENVYSSALSYIASITVQSINILQN